MKNLFIAYCLSFVTCASFAAPQISVVVDGQTYFCSGGGPSSSDCGGKALGFQKVLDACMMNLSGASCMNQYWPKFKQNNPNCIADGQPACLAACMKNLSGAYCANECQ